LVTALEPVESVHLTDLPAVEVGVIDKALERRMERALTVVGLVRGIRMKSNLRVRQPLPRIIVPVGSQEERSDTELVAPLILDEVNVKTIEYVTDDAEIVNRRGKPNFKSIGPKFGKLAKAVAERIKTLTPEELRALEVTGSTAVEAGGETVTLLASDVEARREDIEGWLVASGGGITVALDTHLTDELISEGRARELVNRIQNLRKDAGFEVTDRISIFFRAGKSLAGVIDRFGDYLRRETLAREIGPLTEDVADLHVAEVDIDGLHASVGIRRHVERSQH